MIEPSEPCFSTEDLEAIVSLTAKAPDPQKPAGSAIKAANGAELYAAVADCPPGATILLADGVYDVEELLIEQDGITLRSQSGDRDGVILDGGLRFSKMVRVRGAKDLVIADITMRNSKQYGIFMLGDSDAQRMQVRNVRFENIWVRAVKGTHPFRVDDSGTNLLTAREVARIRPGGGSIRHCLFVNDRVKPFDDDGFNGDYVSAIDMMGLDGWLIADNAFVGLRGMNGRGRGAIFVWVDSRNVVSERNVFVGCDRAICYGNPSGDRPHMTGGIVRNNFICGGAFNAVEIVGAVETKVCNNSVWSTQNRFPAVWFGDQTNCACFNNLISGTLECPDAVALADNLIGDLDGWFANARLGDLHLSAEGKASIAQSQAVDEITEDFDGQPRPARPDVGAHQVSH